MKINLIVIAGQKNIDAMMHTSGMFESFKAYAMVNVLEFTLIDDTARNNAQLVEKIVQNLSSEYRVVAAFVANEPNTLYRDATVTVISDGTKWILLDKVLAAYCMPVLN